MFDGDSLDGGENIGVIGNWLVWRLFCLSYY